MMGMKSTLSFHINYLGVRNTANNKYIYYNDKDTHTLQNASPTGKN